MPIEEILHSELEELAAIADREIRASQGSVSGRWSRKAHVACTAITERLRTAGVDRVIAEWTTTIWILGGRQIASRVLPSWLGVLRWSAVCSPSPSGSPSATRVWRAASRTQ